MRHLSAHIIDDEPLISELLEEMLSRLGYRNMIISQSCKMATEGNGNAVCDVIFVDIQLGDGNGLELLQDLKSQFPLSKIVICSGYGTKANVTTALKRGADGFLVKPFSMASLTELLERLGCVSC